MSTKTSHRRAARRQRRNLEIVLPICKGCGTLAIQCPCGAAQNVKGDAK